MRACFYFIFPFFDMIFFFREKFKNSENENDGRYREIDSNLYQELSNAYIMQYNMFFFLNSRNLILRNISIIKSMFKNNCY